jgi:hypothetical protein
MNLNVEVRDELGTLLQARAEAQGVSPARIVSQVLEETFAQEIHPATPPAAEVRHIWEVIADNMKDVPMKEFAKLPKDGASQVDHYLYGQPKR